MLSHYDIIFELAIKLHKYFSNIYGIWAQLNILFFTTTISLTFKVFSFALITLGSERIVSQFLFSNYDKSERATGIKLNVY